MGHVTMTVAEIRFPADGKARGNIIGTDGSKIGCFREKFAIFQVGQTYDVEVTDGQYCNVVSAKPVGGGSAPAQPVPASHSNGNGHYRPTAPQDSERMFVCALMAAYIKAGLIPAEQGKVVNGIQVLRNAYQQTFGMDDRIFTPSQAGRRAS